MPPISRALRSLPLLALACDLDDDTSTRIGDGHVGAGLHSDADDEPPAALEALTDDLDPTRAGWCDNVTDWPASHVALEAQVLTLVNQRRASGAKCGGASRPKVPALVLNTKLRCAARKHSRDMAVHEFTGHTGSNGSSPWDRIKAAGYTYKTAAENIAWGYTTAAAVVDGWMKSTAHCENIMSAKTTQLGVGYYRSTTRWKHYWTQDFGKP